MRWLLYNGKIQRRKGDFVQALLVEGDRIQGVGTNQEMLALVQKLERLEKEGGRVPESLQKQDLQGRLVLPGFHDSHMHLMHTAIALNQVDLGDTGSLEEALFCCQEALKQGVEKGMFPGKWLEAFGWNEDKWKEKRGLTRQDLDRVSKDTPLVAYRVCGHMCVVNSKGLELLGIQKDSPQPAEGVFQVDGGGEPTGVLLEMLPQVKAQMKSPSIADIKALILEVGKELAATGLTSVQTDDFYSLPGDSHIQRERILQAYLQLSREETLPVRVYQQCLLLTPEDEKVFWDAGWASGQGNDLFRLGPLKLLADGSLGSRTAWLKEDYADDPGNQGMALYTDQELERRVLQAQQRGTSVAIHCIGDGAAEQALQAIQKAMQQCPREGLRHGLVHAQVLTPEQMEKMAQLGVVAYIQPIFLENDLHMAEARLGQQRLKTSYHYRRLRQLGIPCPMGTDAPVEPFDPLKNIYCAVNGKDLVGQPAEGWHPEKLLTVEEAVEGYTQTSAWASFEEEKKGVLAPGYWADFVVLEEDIFSIPPARIKDVGVWMTVMGGRVTFQR